MKEKKTDKIIYLAHYVPLSLKKKRYCNKAAWQVMSYLVSKLKKTRQLEIISASGSINGERQSSCELLDDGIMINLCGSIGYKNCFEERISNLFFKLDLLKLLFKKVTSEQTLIVYHSLFLMPYVKLLKKIKKCRVVLQIAEIYGDVLENQRIKKKELNYLKIADAYIFQSELLNHLFNNDNKPYLILSGTYACANGIGDVFDDDMIHCVYAGTFDRRKGIHFAIDSFRYLTERYVLHILGSPVSEQELFELKDAIEDVNSADKGRILYEGLKLGDEYTEFLSKCQIGLCPQNLSAKFNDTSFPSKILSYMSCGLRVVCIYMPSVKQSKIASHINFYFNDDPKDLARAIKNVDLLNNVDTKAVIKELDNQFETELRRILDFLQR